MPKKPSGNQFMVLKDNPTLGDLHVNALLTNIAVAYMQDDTNFIADRVFPSIPVAKRSDYYVTFERGAFFRDEMQKRAPSTESKGSGYETGSDTYFCEVYALHKDIDDMLRSNADSVFNLDDQATRFLTQKALLKKEFLFKNAYLKTGVWTTDVTGVAANPGTNEVLQWSDAASTPIEDVQSYRTNVLGLTGYEPNTLIISKRVYDKLINHPDIIDRIKYGQTPGAPAQAGIDSLRRLFEIPNIHIMKAIYNAGKEGADDDFNFIGGDMAWLGYVTPTPGMLVPSAGYTFVWTGYIGSNNGVRMKSFRMENINSDRQEIELALAQKLVGADLGVYFDQIIASTSGQGV